MLELEAVFLYNLGGRFMEISKVAYRYLQRQPDGRLMLQHVMDFLVDVGRIPAGQPVAATPVRIAEPPAPETEAAMGNSEEDDSDYATATASSSDAQEGGEGGAKPGQLAVPVISFRHRLQFQGWRTCHAFFSSLI
ncbi:hypothetical protein PIB30_028418 [Stylosanthes scabra]|uniref:Uncharacterized protein n=1 Tax=Stylosanthes scabra TaxID=79078 RepID=A0ABU6VAF9_9FABA|nr:hypothetical protein [Stylosanthes scabra]